MPWDSNNGVRQQVGAWEEQAELLGGAVPVGKAAGSGLKLAGGALVGGIGSLHSLSVCLV